MNVELRQIRHALAVAERKSFARAAEDLNLSQSALSRSVQALERQLGTPLFVRSAVGVLTTDVGRLFLERGQGLLDMAQELDLEVMRNRSLQRGRVVVGAGPAAMEYLAAGAATEFMSEFPMVTLEVRSASLIDIRAPLRSRELDFVVARPERFDKELDVEVESLCEHPVVVMGRAGHPLAGKAALSLADTFDHPWVSVGRMPQGMQDVLLPAHQSATSDLRRQRAFPALHCSSMSMARQAVISSDALILLSPVAAREQVENGQMTPLLSMAGILHSGNAIVHLKSRTLSVPALALCEKLRALDARHAVDNARLLASWFP